MRSRREKRLERAEFRNRTESLFRSDLSLLQSLSENRKMVGAAIFSILITFAIFLDLSEDGEIEAKGAKLVGGMAYSLLAAFIIISIFLSVASIRHVLGNMANKA